MKTTLKSLKKQIVLILVAAGALVPQVAMAHGGGMGGGFGGSHMSGSHMSSPSYTKKTNYSIRTSTTAVNKYPVVPKQLLNQTTQTGNLSVVNKYPVVPKQLLNQNGTTTTTNPSSVWNKYPTVPKQILNPNGTTVSTNPSSIWNKFPGGPPHQILNPNGTTTPTPTPTPTPCPGGYCGFGGFGGLPLGFGLFGLPYGTGYGGFGNYVPTSSGFSAAVPATTQTVDGSTTPDASVTAGTTPSATPDAPASSSDSLTPAQAHAVLTSLVNLLTSAR